jgi:hypothetical protein
MLLIDRAGEEEAGLAQVGHLPPFRQVRNLIGTLVDVCSMTWQEDKGQLVSPPTVSSHLGYPGPDLEKTLLTVQAVSLRRALEQRQRDQDVVVGFVADQRSLLPPVVQGTGDHLIGGAGVARGGRA